MRYTATSDTGVINGPGHDGYYGNNLNCGFEITMTTPNIAIDITLTYNLQDPADKWVEIEQHQGTSI